MSLANNKTAVLWRSFMPQKNGIKNIIGSDLYLMQIYEKSLNFKDFNPQTEFTKWAMIETSDFEDVPENMETRILDGGLYAVFVHKGMTKDFPQTSHSKYNPTDENSEEEVWIPSKNRENACT